MKRYTALIPLVALAVLATAGPFAMLHGLSHGGDCPIASAVNLSCSVLSSAAEHLVLFQNLLRAVPGMSVVLLVSLFALVLSVAFRPGSAFRLPILRYAPAHVTPLTTSRLPSLRWLARFETSPTAA